MRKLFLILFTFVSINTFALEFNEDISIHASFRERIGLITGSSSLGSSKYDISNFLAGGRTNLFTLDLGMFKKKTSLLNFKKAYKYDLNLRFVIIDRDIDSDAKEINYIGTNFLSFGAGYNFFKENSYASYGLSLTTGYTKVKRDYHKNKTITDNNVIKEDISSEHNAGFLMAQLELRAHILIFSTYYQIILGKDVSAHDFGIEVGIGF